MPTILTSSNSDGTRRCDATCHNAKRPVCRCVCGGRYHGKGTVAAQEQLTKDWLSDAGRALRAEIEADGGWLVPVQQALLGLDGDGEA